jgi:hypothetical protein
MHMMGGFGDLSVYYYAHHFDVGSVDDLYHLPIPDGSGTEGHVLKLRLNSSGGGRVLIDVDHLSGNMSQVQLNSGGNWAELHYKCCMWHLADHQGATCT